jgi:hypothetical protein
MAEFVRIEDFIALAKEGKQVNASIELRKKLVSEKVHPGTFDQIKGEVDMYLLFSSGIILSRSERMLKKYQKYICMALQRNP